MATNPDVKEGRVPAFCPRLLQVAERPPSPKPRLMLLLLLGLLVALFVWAVYGRLDVVARAEGRLVPEGRVKVVQPFERGRVKRILVEEGDRVAEGQTLVLMDAKLVQADLKRVEGRLAKARLELRRIRAELQGGELEKRPADNAGLFDRVRAKFEGNRRAFRDSLDRQRAGLQRTEKELAAARATRKRLAKTLPLLRTSEKALGRLEEKGYAPRVKLLDKRRARIETQQKLAAQRHRIQALEAEMDAIHRKIQSLRSSYRKRLLKQRLEVAARIEELSQSRRKLGYRRNLMRIGAPEAGVVKRLATHTRGSVVPSGAVLMELVPSDEPLKAEVRVSNRDIGFVHPGQTARLKLTAYDFQRYGTIEAEVEHLSPDANRSRGRNSRPAQGVGSPKQGSGYPALLSLSRQHVTNGSERLDLRAGMNVTAEIKLGTRTVLEYVLSPVTEGLKEAGTQR